WAAATAERKYIVPLYVIQPELLDSVGPFRRRQLVANLQALDFELAEGLGGGGRLCVLFGDPRELVPEAVKVYSVGSVHFHADVSPFSTKRDEAVEGAGGPGAHVLRRAGAAAGIGAHQEGLGQPRLLVVLQGVAANRVGSVDRARAGG